MDIPAYRPVSVPQAPIRLDPGIDRNSVKTDLPLQQSVGSLSSAGQTRQDKTRDEDDRASQNHSALKRIADQVSEDLQRKVEIDKKTGEFVFRSIDPHTKRTIHQFPDDMVLRLKAYRREQDEKAAVKEDAKLFEKTA